MNDQTKALIRRAQEAVTVEEECSVVWDAIRQLGEGHNDRSGLATIVGHVRSRFVPRDVLLGVVAALVPEEFSMLVNRNYEQTLASAGVFHPKMNDGKELGDWVCSGDCYYGPTPALALLIAILEAQP